MNVKCTVCGKYFEADVTSGDLSGCSCPLCGGALAPFAVHRKKKVFSVRILSAVAVILLFAALVLFTALLWIRVNDLQAKLAAVAGEQIADGEKNTVNFTSLAADVARLKQTTAALQEDIAAMAPAEELEAVVLKVEQQAGTVAFLDSWQKKVAPALEIIGDIEAPDNIFEISFANVYERIDELALREEQRYLTLCAQLNDYAFRVNNSLGALEADMDTIFAFASDAVAAINGLSSNIDGMENDIARLIRRVNDSGNDRIIFVDRTPPRIPGRPDHRPRPDRPGPHITK